MWIKLKSREWFEQNAYVYNNIYFKNKKECEMYIVEDTEFENTSVCISFDEIEDYKYAYEVTKGDEHKLWGVDEIDIKKHPQYLV